jgi:uncharacterized protein (TIGR03067 family)
MKIALLTILGAGLLMTTDAKDTAQADAKRLQGKWVMTSGVMDGNEIPKDQLKGELNFKENKYSWSTGDGQSGAGTFTIDPSKKPKAMDVVPSDGPAQGQTIEEIYEIEGDKLKICMALPGNKRPTEFKAEAGSNCWFFTYKRGK